MESTSEVVAKTASEKSVEKEQQAETTVNLKNGEKATKKDTDNGGVETVNGNEATSAKQDKIEDTVEEEEEEEIVEEEIEESDSDSVEQKDVEKVVDTSDGSAITTVTNVKEQPTPTGTTTTKTVITTKVSKEVTPQSQATTTTVITTTPPTPTTEETKTLNSETKSELPAATQKNVEEVLEEEEEEEEDSEEEDEKEEVSTKTVQQQHQLQKDQIPQVAVPTQESIVQEESVTDAPAKIDIPQIPSPTKQDNLNNTIKDIISSIDSNIIAEENIAALKQRELELLKKQQELAMEIQQQQLLAQKLASENQLRQQAQLSSKTQPQTIFAQQTQPITNVSKYSTYEEEKQDENNFTRKTETFETRESTNVSKKIDLHKIFTPATDAEEILPKNRKLYASSAFYSPTLHPTVEDQVKLARKISHSLSDITNQQSKGQSMYVNRKKRSVKWVHEGCGQDYHQYQQQPKPPTSPSILPAYTDAAKHRVQLNLHQEQLLEKYAKPGLKVVKTPWEAALESGSASAAFVDEQKLSNYPTPARSPAPQYFDASQGGMCYEPASVPTVADTYNKPYSTEGYQEYTPQTQPQHKLPQTQYERRQPTVTNPQRDLAYKPSIPQGWRAPSMSLPKDLYVPKEIPLQSYAPPPVAAIPSNAANSMKTSYDSFEPSWKPSTQSHQAYQPQSPAAPFATPTQTSAMPFGGGSTFPIGKPSQTGFSTTYGGSNQPPKQQYLPPQSYQTVPQTTTQNVPQVNFNPSPLPYDKLAKFENPSVDSFNGTDSRRVYSPPRSANLNVHGGKVRNTSPAPFGSSPYQQQQQRPYTPSYESNSFAGTPSISPRPPSSLQQQYSGNITPTPQVSSFSSNQLLNAPSYNSSARGWRCTGPSSTGYQVPLQHQQRPMANSKPHIVSGGSMPYTDF